MAAERPPQLRMIWPPDRQVAPAVSIPAGFALRPYRDGDADAWLRVMHLAGFTSWTADSATHWLAKALPDGVIFAVHEASGAVVATAGAYDQTLPGQPPRGELGWVAGDPAFRGLGLGRAVCAAVIERFLAAGYHDIYLLTDDVRLPAIRIYLRLGMQPVLNLPGMAERWRAVCATLGVDYD